MPDSWIDTVGWQNSQAPLDVNHDRFISPIDALLVINDINASGSRQVTVRVPVVDLPDHAFLDVNGDSSTSPIDALLVINAINSSNGQPIPSEIPEPTQSCEVSLPLLVPKSVRTNTSFQITLPNTDVQNKPITYSLTVDGVSEDVRETLAALALEYHPGANNIFDLNDRALSSAIDGSNYFITPDGMLHVVTWEGGFVTGHEEFARLSQRYYDEPTLLTADSLQALKIHIEDGVANVEVGPQEFVDSSITFIASVGSMIGMTTQVLTVFDNLPPVVEAISDLRMRSGGSQSAALQVSDSDSDAIGITATYYPQAAFELKNAWRLQANGELAQFNRLGADEKWFAREDENFGDVYFFILPNGEVHRALSRFAGESVTTASLGQMVELSPAYYADLSLILDALPPPVTVQVTGNQLTVSSIEGYSGEVDVVVTVSDGKSRAKQTLHVQTDAPANLDSTLKVSPVDGTVYQLEGDRLLRNNVVFLRNVSHFEMLPNGDVLTNGRGATDPQPVPGTTFTLRYFRGNALLKYDGIADFNVDSKGNIFIWGESFEQLRAGQRVLMVNNVAQVMSDGDSMLVLSQSGSLERITSTDRSVLAESVKSFNLSSGIVSLNRTDGTSQVTVLSGEIEGLVNSVLASDPRLQSIPPQGPPVRGVVGRYASGLEALVASVGIVSFPVQGTDKTSYGSGTILALGGNRYVLTAAHVVETKAVGNVPGIQVDHSILQFLPNPNIKSAPKVIQVDTIFGRNFFAGRDLALLELHEPVSDVIGAELPDGTNRAGDRVIIAGYGYNNDQAGGTLHYGYGTLDGVVGRDSDRIGPLIYNEFKDNEAAAEHGDSGGPDLLASITDPAPGYWTPVVMSVHSYFVEIGTPNDRVDKGEKTYSVQIVKDVVNVIKSLVLPLVKVADIMIEVTDDGDGALAGTGEWLMEVTVNNDRQFIRRDYDDDPAHNQYRVRRVVVEALKAISIGFKGKEIDSGFFDSSDPIAPVTATLDIPPRMSVPPKLLGSGVGGTKYKLWVVFRYASAGDLD